MDNSVTISNFSRVLITDEFLSESKTVTIGTDAITGSTPDGTHLTQHHGKLAFVYILYICIGVTGFLSNAFVVYVIARTPSMRNRFSNWFVTNLSVTDAIASVFVIINAAKIQFQWRYEGIVGYLLCHLITGEYLLFFLFTVSTYNLTVIAVERYLGVVHPIFHRNHFGRKSAMFALFAPWLIPLPFNLPINMRMTEGGGCEFVYLDTMLEQRSLALYTFIGQFLLPLSVMVFCYARMGQAMRRITMRNATQPVIQVTVAGPGEGEVGPGEVEAVPGEGEDDGGGPGREACRREKNVLKTLVILCALFVLCTVQNHVAYFLYNMGVTGAVQFGSVYNHFTIACIDLNCAVNPFVYAFNYEQFKRGVRKLFGRSSSNSSSGTCDVISVRSNSRSNASHR